MDLTNTPNKYDKIGLTYNTTRQADPYLLSRIYHHLDPKEQGHYLDLGCGTGNYTIEFAKKGIRFTGVDPSEKMLDEAKSKFDKIEWVSGVAEQIPFGDNFFDGAIATLTIHHWVDLEKGFAELSRVLKPGSKVVLFTSDPEQMAGYWLNHYFPELIERSAQKMPPINSVVSALNRAGLNVTCTEKYFVQDDLRDLFLLSGKNRPEIYFDENVRKGISTFASLAHREEVDVGLQRLREDIESGVFDSVKMKYEGDLGDYVFIVAEKE